MLQAVPKCGAAACRLPLRLPRRKRYAVTYLVTDVLACVPFGCIMVTANPSLNYYNAGELFKSVGAAEGGWHAMSWAA